MQFPRFLALAQSALRLWFVHQTVVLALAGAPDPSAVDYSRDIQPILSKTCFTCHGPDEETRKADLRLDLRDAALRPARSGAPAIVPGRPEASELIARLTTADADDRMPPARSGKSLSPQQTEMLRRWIAAGAEYRKHWAYEKPVRPEPPRDLPADMPIRNPIDAFVVARLRREGLRPNPPASRETLIRRLSLDLTGLPPTVEEVDAFLKDDRPDATDRLLERLLASPRYGERWARPWLDQARYADTNGYEKDERRSAWPWRDWVIRALNADLPFDRFTIEQLAGDLLPNATQDQKIATGFHRHTMTNTEGGTDDEEFRVAAVVDRLNTTFAVWMGTTLSCAQCHTHKYDPFTKKEYYQLFAILNQTQDRGKTLEPILTLPTPEQAAHRQELEARIAPLQQRLDRQTPELEAALDRWIADAESNAVPRQTSWRILDPRTFSATGGVLLEKLDDASLLSTGALPDQSDYHLEFPAVPEGRSFTALRVEALTDPRLPNQGPGRHEESDFTLTTFLAEVETPQGETNRVTFNLAYADFEMGGYPAANAIDANANSGWAVAAFEPTNRVSRQAVFVTSEPANIPPQGRLRIVLRQQSSRAQHLIGRVRLAIGDLERDHHARWAAIPLPVRAILSRPAPDRTPEDREKLARHYRSLAPELAETRRQVEELRKQLPKDIPSTLVMAAVEQPRETHVMIRGNFLNRGEKVEPAVPAALHPFPPGQILDRLGFAHWLVSPDNPLVGRVTVNRIWSAYFGTGLVETSEDFGSQGEPPSHPEILDWLASEFVEPRHPTPGESAPRPWSLKHLHRLIAGSATYQQSARVASELAERDPFNRLLARGPRFRMEAEMLRDNALAVAGLLNPRIGGPSVMPYQPDGVWFNPYSSDRWETSKDGDQFRRGLYTFWRRTSAYASFVAFDAPSREVCTERRPRSNTPVQALVTLNDPAFVAASRALARVTMEQGGDSREARLAYAFRRALARPPTPDEATRLLGLHETSRQRFLENPAAAESFLAADSAPLPDPAARADQAAWQVVAGVLLNLDETLTKG